MAAEETIAKGLVGWRKILVWAIVTGLNAALLWFGKISGDHYEYMTALTTMAVLAANAVTHIAQAWKK